MRCLRSAIFLQKCKFFKQMLFRGGVKYFYCTSSVCSQFAQNLRQNWQDEKEDSSQEKCFFIIIISLTNSREFKVDFGVKKLGHV